MIQIGIVLTISFMVIVLLYLLYNNSATFDIVENLNKKTSADKFYWHLKTKNGNSYLFTDEQIDIAKERANKNKEDLK